MFKIFTETFCKGELLNVTTLFTIKNRLFLEVWSVYNYLTANQISWSSALYKKYKLIALYKKQVKTGSYNKFSFRKMVLFLMVWLVYAHQKQSSIRNLGVRDISQWPLYNQLVCRDLRIFSSDISWCVPKVI